MKMGRDARIHFVFAAILLASLTLEWLRPSPFPETVSGLVGASSASQLPNPSAAIWQSAAIWDLVRYGLGLAGLLFVALRIVKNQPIPAQSFLWILAACGLIPVLFPESLPVLYREKILQTGIEQRLDTLVSSVCGIAAGIVVARLVAPILLGKVDQKLLSQDRATTQARTLIGSFGVAGVLFGWQAVTPIGLMTASIALIVTLVSTRLRLDSAWCQWSVWIWLSVILYRSSWSQWHTWMTQPGLVDPLIRHLLVAMMIYLMAIFWARSQTADTNNPHNSLTAGSGSGSGDGQLS
jgi:hypothetical protein